MWPRILILRDRLSVCLSANWLWKGTITVGLLATMFIILHLTGRLVWCPFAGFIICLYCFLTRTHGYWAERGVPGPRPLPLFGTYLGQFFYSFHVSEEERLKKFGHVYGIYEGTKPGLIVGDPVLLKDIMVQHSATFYNRRSVKTTHPVMSNFLSSLEDKPWKRVRGLVRKTFKPRELKSVHHLLQDSCLALIASLDHAAATGSDIDLKNLFGAYTMEVISRSCFATVPDEEFVRNASSLFTFPFWRKFCDYTMPKWFLDSWLVQFTVLPKAGMDFFRNITTRLIADRLAEPQNRRNDFLQLLMEAKHEGDGLSEDEILSQSVLFYSVGYETSSQLLTYCIYCLALNPDLQDRLRKDLIRILTEANISCDADIPYDVLDQSDYLSAVIAETLRLYNPVLRMERKAVESYILHDQTGKEILVEKDMVVGIPVWALHHSDEFYPDPERFDPERFLGEDEDGWKKRARSKFANVDPVPFLPFGIGPRNCIGTRFAIMETKMALMIILRDYRLMKTAGTKVPLKFFPTGRPLLGCDKVLVGVRKLKTN